MELLDKGKHATYLVKIIHGIEMTVAIVADVVILRMIDPRRAVWIPPCPLPIPTAFAKYHASVFPEVVL